ncbi:hypothetical protein N431DRAFT_556546 [Stipitochalara longipes BDJ]|nr:hypothetical protein N431DRAFT_556546 [Stipitochalara longipes BDJ]
MNWPSLYLAPSWSWLSILSTRRKTTRYVTKLNFGDIWGTQFTPSARVIECTIEPLDPNFRLGQLKGEKIVLTTKVLNGPPKSKVIWETLDEELGDDAAKVETDMRGPEMRSDIFYAKLGECERLLGEKNMPVVFLAVGFILKLVDNGYFMRI